MANKWTFTNKVSLSSNPSLQKIVQFYVWETPVPHTSQKGKTFQQLGWSGGSFNTLRSLLRERSDSFSPDKWIAPAQKNIVSKLAAMNCLDSFTCDAEFAVHTIKTGLNKTEALFYFIRNAFAHGGFRICTYKGEKYYALENRQGQKLKGRALLKESTLLSWSSLLKKPRRQ